ncbi:MAG: hypothetical protein COU46_03525 [Candidatus Niyogibacteria bacterium CG10_big_fil_rev_8_21_14_0_10_42_19]|uniref:tRNA pseudouridine(55) synthase n=1 Tax=Candidatus Niyogibacteria bacterium CG10_big_fil_rev_8_21_14_0_10_42_19 TaxID=1974725 RepID=A0A2H0TGX6_9BACT|nr:MAG: hypothetical protein COU46_03525 [Candidatus Niyogibacteria bacterium CG10_big_fil_rev_8_21_14_0_10_42_19]
MRRIINIYKPLGSTPLKAIDKFKKQYPKYKDVPMTYAGRLDPIAEGVLIVLTGSAVRKKNEYLRLDKKYEAEILYGFKTDSFDILDLPKKAPDNLKIDEETFKKFSGDFNFLLPPFSSFKIKGKPIFWWAKQERLKEIEIPERITKIYYIKFFGLYEINSNDLLRSAIKKINMIKGDFRQEKIKQEWQKILKTPQNKIFKIAKITIKASGGTYIRSIADRTDGVLFSLKRMSVGRFNLKNSLIL